MKSCDFNADKFPNCEFVAAQSLSKAQLKKKGKKIDAEESEFSDVKTVHRTPDTEHQKMKIGPEEDRTPDLYQVETNLTVTNISQKGLVKVTSYQCRCNQNPKLGTGNAISTTGPNEVNELLGSNI